MLLREKITDGWDNWGRIYYENMTGEMVVKFYEKGEYLPEADYYTDDLEDARDTIGAWFDTLNARKISS